jgi:hypothetical protein
MLAIVHEPNYCETCCRPTLAATSAFCHSPLRRGRHVAGQDAISSCPNHTNLLLVASTGRYCQPRFPSNFDKEDEPTSGLEPLSPAPARVIGWWSLSVAQGCKSRINKRFIVPSFARYCSVLRPG